MKIDTKKLAALIQSFVDETHGMCVSTGACIGVIDGKQVQLHVVSFEGDDEDDDAMSVNEKNICVSEK